MPQRAPHRHRRARAALVLLQLAVRRLPGLPRPRHPDGGRPRAGRAQPAGDAGRGRDPALEPGARRRLLPAADGRARRRARLRPQHAVGGPARPRRRSRSSTATPTKVHVVTRNRYGRQRAYYAEFEGVRPYIERRHREAESDTSRERFEGFMREVPCPTCGGSRLKPVSMSVTLGGSIQDGGKNIAEVCALPINETADYLRNLDLTARERQIGERVLKEIQERLNFLLDVGLDYLSLDRPSRLAVRRRGAADPAGHPDRRRPGRRPLRARRAVHRPAPARQPPADRDPGPAQGPRQHPDRRRARRGHHPGGRLGRRHRPRRRRARRPGRAQRQRRRTCWPTRTR